MSPDSLRGVAISQAMLAARLADLAKKTDCDVTGIDFTTNTCNLFTLGNDRITPPIPYGWQRNITPIFAGVQMFRLREWFGIDADQRTEDALEFRQRYEQQSLDLV